MDFSTKDQYCSLCTFSKVWTKAKKLYSNDINHLYNIVSNLMAVKKEDMDMQSYLSKLDTLMVEFDALMPFTDNKDKHSEQCGKFFMVLALPGLPPKLDSVCNQILSSPSISSYDTVCEQLLHFSIPQPFVLDLAPTGYTTLVSRTGHQGGCREGHGANCSHPHCSYCKYFGHIEEQCRTNANKQSWSMDVAQLTLIDSSADVSLSIVECNEYLQLKAVMQSTIDNQCKTSSNLYDMKERTKDLQNYYCTIAQTQLALKFQLYYAMNSLVLNDQHFAINSIDILLENTLSILFIL